MKLRGRVEAPDWSRGCILSSGTRGDTTVAHGPLQRLLEAQIATTRFWVSEVTFQLFEKLLGGYAFQTLNAAKAATVA